MTREEMDEIVIKTVGDCVELLRHHGVPEDKISAALTGIGIRIALTGGVNIETVHSLADDIAAGIKQPTN